MSFIQFSEYFRSTTESYKSNFNIDVLKKKPKALELILNAYKKIGENSALNSNLIYLVDHQERQDF